MKPDARIQSAIEILDQWLGQQTGLDRVLTQWARRNRFAGSGDRAAIADLVYSAVRRLRSANWVAGGSEVPSGRTLMHGTAILDDLPIDSLFTGLRHAPEPLTEAETSARRAFQDAPPNISVDIPDWLEPFLADVPKLELCALRTRAALDLRVNTVKATPDEALAALAKDDIAAHRLSTSSTALRVTTGNRKVARSDAYLTGMIEIQDAGSQALADLAEARAGELIVDLCAGGGGKSLALAASTGGHARLIAHDISADRLSDLPTRAQRAGAEIEIAQPNALHQWQGQADLVFVDAPCSGSGAWRRNPDAKWRLTAQRLKELNSVQSDLLQQATELCKPSGRIVYGTCSLLACENQDRVDAFLAKTGDWRVSRDFTALPSHGSDGFFGVVLTR